MIYDKSNKEIKKELINFGKTTYGKIMFLICYTPFFISILLMILSLILYMNNEFLGMLVLFILLIVLSIFVFCIGSYNFYKELRVYINSK